MKKSLFLAIGLFSVTAFAQTGKVGINTEKPEATLSVKSKPKSEPYQKSFEAEDSNGKKLFTVMDNGKVGIGVDAPTTQLHIVSPLERGGFRLKDGSEAEGRVLTTDAYGNAKWISPLSFPRTSYYNKQRASTSGDFDFSVPSITSIPGIGTYKATLSGYYQVIFHSFFKLKSETGMASYYFAVQKEPRGGSPKTVLSNDEVYAYTQQNSWINTHYSTVVQLNANDVISFGITPRDGVVLTLQAGHLGQRNMVEVIYLGE